MTDLMPSLIRTLVPIVVGPLVARFGLDVNDPDTFALTSGVISYLFYVLVRVVETRYPAFGYLLGIAKAPAYSPEPSPSPGPGENVEAVVVPDEGAADLTLVEACMLVLVTLGLLWAFGWLPR
jgi:hypothetical protein